MSDGRTDAAAGAAGGLAFEEAARVFRDQALFEAKTWRYSPYAYPLAPGELDEIRKIGQACHDFQRALETLYLRSAEGKNLLRNRRLTAPWVAEYLDRGKPRALIEHARSAALRGATPPVLRPDLLLTDEGFALTELDAVPGGIGLTAFLNRVYEKHGGADVVGAGDAMVDGFHDALAARAPAAQAPYIAVAVSDEAATYRPEMEWLAKELRAKGRRAHVFHPDAIMTLGDAICAGVEGDPREVDVLYRFWELFDMANVPVARQLLDASAPVGTAVTPPMRPFQEEKLALALFRHHLLDEFWRENMPRESFRTLSRIVPETWVMDPVDLPPNAVLDGPEIGGKPLRRWEDLAEAGRKERNLVIKMSGFNESAWGARSVTVGSDVSRAEWEGAIDQAVAMAPTSPHILQRFAKPKRVRHPVYENDGSVRPMEGRTRLCPYYFVDDREGRVELAGVLATFCPADKKVIHGMKDAVLLPCARSA